MMAAFRFSLIPASSTLPPSAPHPPSDIPPLSPLLAVLFSGIALALRLAAATRKTPSSPGVLGIGLVAWMSARIRLRLDLLRWTNALALDSPDPPPDCGHESPDSSRIARPLAWTVYPRAGSDPDPGIQVESQPQKMFSGECLVPGRRTAVLLGSYIRVREPNQSKDQADKVSRAGHPNQAELSILQWLCLQPSRASFWVQAMKPNGSPLGLCELFNRSRYVWAQIFGPFTYA